MQDLTVAVVGATGLVGELLIRLLEEREFPVGTLRPMASFRSAGQTIDFAGRTWPIVEASVGNLDGADLVFFAATGELSKQLAPAAAEAGATVIDKSGTWRMDEQVPLVVPEINAGLVQPSPGIIACPNCTTIGVVQALAPLHQSFGLVDVVLTTMQAASGAGRGGSDELRDQQTALAKGALCADPQVFSRQLADNVIPHCDHFDDNGFSGEERKLERETRKILGLPSLPVTATCVRVPVQVGHSASILVELASPFELDEVRTCLEDHAGVTVVDDSATGTFPTTIDVQNSDEVLVGRIRRDPANPQRVWLWQVAHNLRKGAATNAIQIAEAWLRLRA